MFSCPNCGIQLEGDESYCPKCGQKQTEKPSADYTDQKDSSRADVVKSDRIDQLFRGKQFFANKQNIFLTALLIFLVISVFVFAGIKIFGKPAQDSFAHEKRADSVISDVSSNHTIVGLFPLTGPLDKYGENSGEAALLAASDVNEWLKSEGKNWRLNLEIADTKTDGYVCQREMQSWLNEGVKLFAGPQASGAVLQCLSFANVNQILFISPSSTSPALAIEDDWLFRFCVDDLIQSLAIAGVVEDIGVEHLIMGWRGDAWGDGLHAATAASASELGVNINKTWDIRYDPTQNNFRTEVKLLDGYVTDLVNQDVALNKIGFCLIAFGEAASFLAEAAKYPQLGQIAWIGSDGTAFSEFLKSDSIASKFASEVKYINPMSRVGILGEQSKHKRVKNHIRLTLNRESDVYAYNTYDIIWGLALAIDEVGYNSVAIKAVLPRVIDEWSKIFGASGHIVLNEYGDRTFTDYDYWLLNDNLEWEIVGYYEGATGRIKWLRRIY